jgi:hypothetical protein
MLPFPAAVAKVFSHIDEQPCADGNDAQRRLHPSETRYWVTAPSGQLLRPAAKGRAGPEAR